MPRLHRIAIVAALLSAALAAPACAQSAVPPQFVGVNWTPWTSKPLAAVDAQFASMPAVGVTSVRAAFDWATAQPTAHGDYDFRATDTAVTLAARRNLAVLPIVIRAPAWARRSRDRYAPPRDPSTYAAFLTALIERYGPLGSFWAEHPHLPTVPVREWQIWNEEDLPGWYHTGRADWARSYTNLLAAASTAVRRADPGARVVLGALTNFSFSDLRRLYRAGARPYFDVTALDPYTRQPAGVRKIVALNRRVMRAAGDPHKPIWVTELGLPASRGRVRSRSTLQTTDAGMARFLTGALSTLAKNRVKLGIERVYWFTWITNYRGGDPWLYSGLFAWKGRSAVAKPAYSSFVRTVRRLEAG